MEATETMRAYIAHNMDRNEELLASLEMAMSETAATRNLAEEGACLLRKVEEEEASHVEACCLAEKKTTMAAKKKKVEEEFAQLR